MNQAIHALQKPFSLELKRPDWCFSHDTLSSLAFNYMMNKQQGGHYLIVPPKCIVTRLRRDLVGGFVCCNERLVKTNQTKINPLRYREDAETVRNITVYDANALVSTDFTDSPVYSVSLPP